MNNIFEKNGFIYKIDISMEIANNKIAYTIGKYREEFLTDFFSFTENVGKEINLEAIVEELGK